MHETRSHFYVTTPIYYVTAKPHLGHLYSTLLADVLTRWHKMQGKKTFFLTGTDEHGQKIAKAAQQAGQEPKTFVDSFIPAYKEVWKKFEIEYSFFMRTTDAYHGKAVQKWLQQLMDQGDIYKSFYEGWYCISCETFISEYVVGQSAPSCPSCGRATEKIAEETYFFRLSAYQEKLLTFYEQNPHFIIPRERAAEVINFVKSGLKDLSISRTTITWGVPFPGDPKHVTYVWADALNNYITAIGYGQDKKEQEFQRWWPADIQIMAKDIIRFHAIYWPAFLMAAGLPCPKHLLVHGWFKVGGAKMSKSLGNVIDPLDLYEKYGADPVRYYLLRQLAITHDGELSIEDLEQRIASELADDLGNLLNRLIILALKNDNKKLQSPAPWSAKSQKLQEAAQVMLKEYQQHMHDCMFHMALNVAWRFINQINAFFHEAEPWKLVKENNAAYQEILAATAESLRFVALLLWPMMPRKMEQLVHALGHTITVEGDDLMSALSREEWNNTFMITKIDPLFIKPVIEPASTSSAPLPVENPSIGIEDFSKVALHIGTIEQAERVEKSDKLLKLQVDLGPLGKRQILSGIAKYNAPEELVGKQAVFVTNLPPRKMMGIESQGMLIATEESQGVVSIISPVKAVANGTRLK